MQPTPPPACASLRFSEFSPKERWKVAWGVAWRIWVASLVVGVIITIVFMVFLAAVGVPIAGELSNVSP